MANFFDLGSYMLQKLVLITLNFKRFHRILCTVASGMFNCRAASMPD
jgi:hypothetical protein